MSRLTSLFVSNHHDHAKLLSPKFGKQLEHVVSNFGPEVFFFCCLFIFFTNSYIYILTTTTNNEKCLVAMEDEGERAQTTHLRCGFFVCLFFLLSHRYSCHHHDHGRHVGMERKDDEQWAQTTRRLGPLDMFFFRLLFFLLSHRYSCHHHDHGQCRPTKNRYVIFCTFYFIFLIKYYEGQEGQRRPTKRKQGPNDVSGFVWALGVFFFNFFYLFY